MTSPISSSETAAAAKRRVPNKAMLLLTGKRFIWLPALNAILLFFFVPFAMLVSGPDRVENFIYNSQLMEAAGMVPEPSLWFYDMTFGNPLTMLLVLVIGLVWAAVLFNYLNENKAVNFFHSLPLNRRSLFINLCLTGAAGILLPILLISAVCLLLLFYKQFSLIFTAGQVLWWTLSSFLFTMVIFASAVMMGMVTGQPLVQPVFAVIFNVLPLGLYTIVFYLLQKIIYGFPANISRAGEYLYNLPLIRLLDGERPGGGYCLVLLGLTVLYLVIAGILYRRRPLERTGDIIVYPALRPVFKYGVTFCVSLCFGILTMEVMGVNLSWWPLLLWAVIGYAVAEMLLQKSVRILSAWKGLAAYCLVFILVVAGLNFDLLGYEKRLPQVDQVAYALLNRSDYSAESVVAALDAMEDQGIRLSPQLYDSLYLYDIYRDPENIQALADLQKELVARKDELKERSRYNDLIFVMKDGSVMRRQYRIDGYQYPEIMKRLEESAEARLNNNSALLAEASDISWMTVRSSMFSEMESALLAPEQIAGLLAAWQRDCQADTYEEMEGERQPAYLINLRYVMPELDWEALQKIDPDIFSKSLLKDITRWYGDVNVEDPSYNRYDQRYESLPVYGSYANTLAWLEEEGLMESLKPGENMVASIRLYKGYNYNGSAEEYSFWLSDYRSQENWQDDYSAVAAGPSAVSYEMEALMADTSAKGEAEMAGDGLPGVLIEDPELIRQVLEEGGFQPYSRLLEESEWDKECWRVDFGAASGYVMFTGYYYDGLPGFLQEAAAQARNSENH